MMFLKGGEVRWMLPFQGDHYRGGYRSFLFVPEQLYRIIFKRGLLIVYGYHLDVSAGVHGKLV